MAVVVPRFTDLWANWIIAGKHMPQPWRDFQLAHRPLTAMSGGRSVIIVSRTAYDRRRAVRLTRYVFRADHVELGHEQPVK